MVYHEYDHRCFPEAGLFSPIDLYLHTRRRRDILKAWETIDCCGLSLALCLSPERKPGSGPSGSAFETLLVRRGGLIIDPLKPRQLQSEK